MPELPEVETIRRQLESQLVGRSFRSIEVLAAKSFQGNSCQILDSPITAIDRRGKQLIFEFENSNGMLVHLKLSGQLVLRQDKEGQESKEGIEADKDFSGLRFVRIKFKLDGGGELWFNDLRKFGWIKVVDQKQLQSIEDHLALGVEPLEEEFTLKYLREKLKKQPKTTIKQFLLDQTNIAGIGNIYADESLFAAMIKPNRRVNDLTDGEISNLRESIQEILEKAILLGGSSDRDYVQTDGSLGRYLVEEGQVYHREGQPCRRCGQSKIERIKIAGRSAHFCPECQK